jgi:mannose-6-phosphate isomerase-like protein (cupin superfamily)
MTHATTTTTPWHGVAARWLADERDGAMHGSGVQLAVAPGAGYPAQRYDDVEVVLYVCSGTGRHVGSDGPIDLAADDSVAVPAGSWHGFENTGSGEALIVLTYTGATTLPWDRAQSADGRTAFDGHAFKHRLHEVDDDAVAQPDRGFHHMKVSFAGAQGAEATTLGSGRWPGGHGQHMWHRHHHADELIYIYEGTAQHMSETGTELLATGHLAWVPADVWHSMRSDDDSSALDSVFFYVGAPSLEASGYEPRHDAATEQAQ